MLFARTTMKLKKSVFSARNSDSLNKVSAGIL